MNKFKKNSIIIFLITILIMWYLFKDNLGTTLRILGQTDIIWLAISIIAFGVYFLLESMVFKDIVRQYKTDYTLKKAIKLNMITKFFDGITPFSSGHQPLQVYEMKKDGIAPTYGTLIVVEQLLIFQFSIVILAIISLISNTIFDVVHAEPFLDKLTIFGYSINITLLVVLYFLCTRINISKKIIHFIIKALSMFKLVKSKDKKIEQWDNKCDEYYQGYLQLATNKKLIVKSICLEITCLIFQFIVPILIFNALGFVGMLNVFIQIIIAVYTFFVGSFIPIPGGTGGIEYAFVGFYSYYIGSEYLSPALLIWRFITYYFPTILGGIVFNLSNKHKELDIE